MNEDERDDNGHLDCCVEFEVEDGQQGKGQKSHSNEICNQNVVPADGNNFIPWGILFQIAYKRQN